MGLINSLIIIDTNSSKQKHIIFQRLLELWEHEIGIGDTPVNKSKTYRVYIKDVILKSYVQDDDRDSKKNIPYYKPRSIAFKLKHTAHFSHRYASNTWN